MTSLAPTLQAFFTERLAGQRRASPFTVEAYRDTFRLLLAFIYQHNGKAPSVLGIDDLDATIIGSFLEHLEQDRGNTVRTRNARLAALHSFFRFASFRHPEHAGLIQRVLAIPPKRYDRALVTFLTRAEVDALVAAPDRSRWTGRRDYALLVLAVQTGLRVSELARLNCQDVHLDAGAYVRCHGKGRKERITPLTAQTVALLRVWMRERCGQPDEPLFPTSRGRPLSTDAIAFLVDKYTALATHRCPSLRSKQVSPHVLRHTCAMQLLQAGVDTSVIALWLGHEHIQTTQIYLHADLSLKERALARTASSSREAPGRYRPPDRLLAFLENL
jgi:integrase/recombinase XerD